MDIYSIASFQFWFFAVLFIFSLYFSFYLPGKIVAEFLEPKSALSRFVFANVLGLVMWGIQGYIFGYLNLRFLTYVYIFYFAYVAYKKNIFLPQIDISDIGQTIRSNKLFTIVITLGVIVQSIPLFGSGLLYSNGVHFIGVHAYDGMMHLSYIQSIVRNFPPIEPGAYPNPITNYHYWTDLVLGDLSRIWKLPISHMFFQYFPLFVSLVTGLTALVLIKVWGGTRNMAFWFLFLLYFSGDAAYLFMLGLHNTFGFYTPAIDNGPTQFLNMPHAVAKPIFLTGLSLFSMYLKKQTLKYGVLFAVVFSVLFGFKVYFGIYIAIGLLFFGGYKLLSTFVSHVSKLGLVRSSIKTWKINRILIYSLSLFGIISLAIYLPPNSDSGGLIFSPLEWPKLFLNSDNIDFREWWLRRQVYEASGNIRNLLILDAVAIVMTLVSVYGTRIIGFFPSKNLMNFLGKEKILLLIPGLLIFQVLSLFTLQESGGFNVFNFFAVSAVILSFFTAFTLGKLANSKNPLARVFFVIFVLLTIPRAIYELGANFDTNRLRESTAVIRNEELRAFSAIREKTPPASIVQSHPLNPLDSRSQYVAFFTDRNTYLTGTGIQETHNQPIQERKVFLKETFLHTSEEDFKTKLDQVGIGYVYLHKTSEESLVFPVSDRFFEIIYEDNFVLVLRLKDQNNL